MLKNTLLKTATSNWGPSFTLKMSDPVVIIRFSLNVAILAVVVVSVFMLIWNGFKFAISGGKQDKVDEAKKGILYALIGIAVAVAAYVVVAVLFKFLTGVPLDQAFKFVNF